MRSVVVILAFIALILVSWSAPPKKNKDDVAKQRQGMYDDAMYFYESEDWKEAVFSFLKLTDTKNSNANINFLIGMCYLNIPGQEPKAIPYLELASKKLSPEWENTFEQTKAPLHCLFYLGNAYRINNQIDEALKIYDKFQNHPFFENHYNQGMVEREIAACERAKTIRDKPINANFYLLDSVINNSQSNYKPVVSYNDSIMVYMNGLKFYNAIFITRFKNGNWTEPEDISSQVGSDGDSEPCSLSFDGKQLYLVKKVKGQKDIYVSNLDGKLWTPMVPLNKNINTSKDETHACISADGKTLFFSSDRRGGQGGLDIWRSEKDKNGEWGSATNMGKVINTPLNENMPFVTENGKYLFFVSEGHLNMGGYDIFYSKKLSGKNWDNSLNIGFPINTTSDNPYFCPVINGRFGYMSLIKPEGKGVPHIYKIENLSFNNDSTISK